MDNGVTDDNSAETVSKKYIIQTKETAIAIDSTPGNEQERPSTVDIVLDEKPAAMEEPVSGIPEDGVIYNESERNGESLPEDPSFSMATPLSGKPIFKGYLRHFAHKEKLPYPTYETVAVDEGGFFSTVTFNGNEYKAMAMCPSRRKAENNAAYAALNELGIPLPSGEKNASSADAVGDGDEKVLNGEISNALPKIYLPGDEKFISYRNSLQDYCHKKQMDIPKYEVICEGNVYFGTVSFQSNNFRAEKAAGSIKEASSSAAYQVLIQLGYCNDWRFNQQSNNGKQEPLMFKLHLTNLAQKNNMPHPTYETVTVNDGFLSTVTFNGNQYKGMYICKKLKHAEHNAAQVALNALIGIPMPSAGQNNTFEETEQNENHCGEDQGKQEPLLFKGQLKDIAQKRKLQQPIYKTVTTDDGFFSTVIFNGNQFKGIHICRKRKHAENNAAQVALHALVGIPMPSDGQYRGPGD